MTTLTALKSKYPTAETFTFGDNPDLCRRLITLVRQGKKTATCGALSDFTAEGEPLPVVGRCDIALNWNGSPALVIRTTQVTQIRFCDVTEAMALAEGENDSLAGWRRDHEAFFTRNGGFSPDMMLVFEHFELVEDLA
ncbi:ASCH domain-containing protein [Cognatiyoonia sp. IB215446]|uniref:ASCH domain-containing protein n=1 Tax=Cognatiyoonia sp. IB215446 TaxID=3097355 RepID=UPI002A16E7E4|nr:ASCH domain-containing protein [Cognatiyoonia sp. IB215446]MDX8346654.1 ASCH domain-containing protein [Cognatiyoonia sp. IB215446]